MPSCVLAICIQQDVPSTSETAPTATAKAKAEKRRADDALLALTIPNIAVKLVNRVNGYRHTALTDAWGVARFRTAIPAGKYRVVADFLVDYDIQLSEAIGQGLRVNDVWLTRELLKKMRISEDEKRWALQPVLDDVNKYLEIKEGSWSVTSRSFCRTVLCGRRSGWYW